MRPRGQRIAVTAGLRAGLTLVLLALPGAACGDPPPSTNAPSSVAVVLELELPGGPEAELQSLSAAEPIQLRLTLRNPTDSEIRLAFASGRTHDVVITDESGAVRWRWSEGRMFSQALSELVLGPGEDQTFELLCNPGEIADPAPAGERYRATALIPAFEGEVRSPSIVFVLQ